MPLTLLFQLIVFIFLAFNILILTKLFPVEPNQRKKPRPKKA